MKTKAVRLHGKSDLRLEEFDLPPAGDDGLLAKVVSDSICMSSFKAAAQGADHKRVPNDVARRPVIIGHEFCGEILETGPKWAGRFKAGERFAIQPALNDPADIHAAPGYSFGEIGGAATYIRIPGVFVERGCLLKYDGPAFYLGSLGEPVSCVIGGFRVNYHAAPGGRGHKMGIAEGGAMALLAGVGPMGLGAIDYALHGPRRPRLLAVADIDEARLARAEALHPPAAAARCGVRLAYINTRGMADAPGELMRLNGGAGYDDVFVYAPVAALIAQADAMLAHDGCLNFFAGPTDPAFSAPFNFYNAHYSATHIAGNSGGDAEDLAEALSLMSSGALNPSAMITHICGLDAVAEATLRLPEIPGGKKLAYTHIRLPLTAVSDFERLGAAGDPMFAALARATAENNGLWCPAAERILLEQAPAI